MLVNSVSNLLKILKINKFIELIVIVLVPLIFVINLHLIYLNKKFTIYRGLLFYTSDINWVLPLITFILLYLLILITIPKLNLQLQLSKIKLILTMIAFASLSQIIFFYIPEVNPDFIRYLHHAKILASKGALYYFEGWGSKFSTHTDMPTGSFHVGLIFALFGVNRLAVQLVHTIFYILTAILVFILGYKLFNKNVAVFSALLFISFPFMKTQVPLLLVDVTSTFYITLFAVTSYLYIRDSKPVFLILSIVSFFMAIYSKILAPVFIFSIILGLLCISIFENKVKNFSILVVSSLIPVLLYLHTLEPLFNNYISKMYLIKLIHFKITFEIIFGLSILFMGFLLLIPYLYNKFSDRIKVSPNSKWKDIAILLSLASIYCLVTLSSTINLGKSHFYLRALPNSVGLLCTILSILSVGVGVIRKDKNIILPTLWFLLPVFLLPHTMYKYFQPAYPALAILCGYTLSAINNIKMKRVLLVSAIASNILIASLVYYPMCFTAQTNIMLLSEELKKDNIDNLTVVYLPYDETWRAKGRISMFKHFLPMWIEYYSGKRVNISYIVVLDENEAHRIRLENLEDYVCIITDKSRVDNMVSQLTQEYSIIKTFNVASHAAYWWNTRWVILLESKYVIRNQIILNDRGILDNRVRLYTLYFKDENLINYKQPIYIIFKINSKEGNRFALYEFFEGRFHLQKVYSIPQGVSTIVYEVKNPDYYRGINIHIHELNKKEIDFTGIIIRSESKIIVTWQKNR